MIAEARAKLPKAPGESDLRDFGDRTMLTRTMVGATYAEVTNRFGSQFADRLQDMPIGSWQGPVESGFGTHLVFLSERSGGETPPLETVREEVKNDWISDMRIRSNKAVYESWKSNYSITVESQTAE